MRPLCEIDGCTAKVRQYPSGNYAKKCDKCRRSPEALIGRRKRAHAKKRGKERPWILHKKDYCEGPECSWTGPFVAMMLHVDHIDGDKSNNDPSNYMTLCANCHMLKTWLNQEYLPIERRGRNVLTVV